MLQEASTHMRGLLRAISRRISSAPKLSLNTVRRGLALWSVEQENWHQYEDCNKIVNEPLINDLLERTKEQAKDPERVRSILEASIDRALLKAPPAGGKFGKGVPADKEGEVPNEFVQGLTLDEAATLLNLDTSDSKLMGMLFDAALCIKEKIYGRRVVLFAPVYLANYCVNSCRYCAFRGANKEMQRSMLTMEELKEEIEALEAIGHKRLLLLTGEHPKYPFDKFLEAVHVVGNVKMSNPCGEIRRINVEIPSLSVSDMRRLKATKYIGTYTLFQETYHRATFKHMHPYGPKSDYDHRLLTMDRAQIGGLDDVGIGALFGLADYRFEVMAMLMHAHHLDRTYGTGPHTISIPRMQPAQNAPAAMHIPHPVSDDQFKKLVAVIRCAVPYTGMILSTRESAEVRRELLNLGISQISAGSRTDVGAYRQEKAGTTMAVPECEDDSEDKESEGYKIKRQQFSLQDHRPLDTVVHDLMQDGFIPSWCTACYRKGRTGPAFMQIAKKGDIQNFCLPNALLTLQEYLEDFASPQTKRVGEEVIQREKGNMVPHAQEAMEKKRQQMIKEGKRDLYF